MQPRRRHIARRRPYIVPKGHIARIAHIAIPIGIYFTEKSQVSRLGFFHGSPCWARTNDIVINSHALYRLS